MHCNRRTFWFTLLKYGTSNMPISTNTHRLRLLEVVLMQSKGGSVESAFLCFTWDHTSVLLHTVPVTYEWKESDMNSSKNSQHRRGTGRFPGAMDKFVTSWVRWVTVTSACCTFFIWHHRRPRCWIKLAVILIIGQFFAQYCIFKSSFIEQLVFHVSLLTSLSPGNWKGIDFQGRVK